MMNMSHIITKTEHLDQFDPERLDRQLLMDTFNHWRSLLPDDKDPFTPEIIPTVWQIDLKNLQNAADYSATVSLFDESGLNPKYIFAGRGLNKLFGRTIAGKYLSQLTIPLFRKEPINAYERVHFSAKPLFTRRKFRGPLSQRGYSRLILPLAENDILAKKPTADANSLPSVTHALITIIPDRSDTKTYEDWRNDSDFKEWIDYLESISNQKTQK